MNGGDLPAQWWTLFRSPELDQLIRAALAHNPSLEAAQAALARRARTTTPPPAACCFPM
ncbi:efflux transporter, outer membrane factor (OMF) lipoprotein, NodT family [Chromobacterium violaceum]|uniref:Efflux transporter, outer membrane factor (OMF) lipoprotein, NodT family n=1 Tax=Chromobacterium violaceum TaxID=536 RepID=A0A447TAF4_CHRVL|nr:efflux transporter, outer membrane factor (OMF) lipoprotein, NodT family [Chromobacterium violaceum]